MRRKTMFGKYFRVRSRRKATGLRGERRVDLLPVDLMQQFLDAVIGAVDPNLKILNKWAVRGMDKSIAIDAVCLIPFARPPVAEEQDVSHAVAERIVAVLMDEGC